MEWEKYLLLCTETTATNWKGSYPMRKLTNLLAGVALVSASISPTVAQAQIAPGAQSGPVNAYPASPAATPVAQAAPEQMIAVTRDHLTGGVRAVRPGDNDRGVISLEKYMLQYPEEGEAGFRAIQRENEESCTDTGGIVRESIAIAEEAREIDVDLGDLGPILVNLGRAQNRAAGLSTGMAVVSTAALCVLSLGFYCLAASAGGIGNIGQTSAHKKTQRVDRETRVINVRQSRLQIRAMLLTMRANIIWANAMQGYCLRHFPQQTLGTVT